MPKRSGWRVAPDGDLALLRRELNQIFAEMQRRFAALEAPLGPSGGTSSSPLVPAISTIVQEHPRGTNVRTISTTLDFIFDGNIRILGSLAYELSFPFIGTFTAGQEIALHEFVRTVTFPANFASTSGPPAVPASLAKLGTASTGTAVFTLNQNGSSIGTITFTASQTGVLATSGGTAITFAPGDILSLVAPSPADATAADLTINITGTRSNP